VISRQVLSGDFQELVCSVPVCVFGIWHQLFYQQEVTTRNLFQWFYVTAVYLIMNS